MLNLKLYNRAFLYFILMSLYKILSGMRQTTEFKIPQRSPKEVKLVVHKVCDRRMLSSEGERAQIPHGLQP